DGARYPRIRRSFLMQTTNLATLSPVQTQVIAALAQGRTITAAAAEAGIHRNTIHNWLHEPAFQSAFDQAQCDYSETLSDLMHERAARALETLRETLNTPKASPSVRTKAALAILQRPHFPKPGWHLPMGQVGNLRPIVNRPPSPVVDTAAPVTTIARSAPCP